MIQELQINSLLEFAQRLPTDLKKLEPPAVEEIGPRILTAVVELELRTLIAVRTRKSESCTLTGDVRLGSHSLIVAVSEQRAHARLFAAIDCPQHIRKAGLYTML